jgi:hypothetical protein
LVRVEVNCEYYYSGVCGVFLLFFFFGFFFSYSGRSVARQQLLATLVRLGNREPLGAGSFCAPDLLLAKSGSDGLTSRILLWAWLTKELTLEHLT